MNGSIDDLDVKIMETGRQHQPVHYMLIIIYYHHVTSSYPIICYVASPYYVSNGINTER
jgi:hypothetical protein